MFVNIPSNHSFALDGFAANYHRVLEQFLLFFLPCTIGVLLQVAQLIYYQSDPPLPLPPKDEI